jgi:hypothetical protein
MPDKSQFEIYYASYASIGTTVEGDVEPELPPPSFQAIPYSSERYDQGSLPGWQNLIRDGQNATTALSGVRRKLEVREGEFSASFQPPFFDPYFFVTRARGDLCQSFSPNGVSFDLTFATDEAKRKFVKNCLQEMQALEGQVFLGELGQTLHMIKNPMKALRESLTSDYFRKLKKRRRGTKKQKRQVLAETWLEYVFGVQPLVHDIEDGLEALRRFSQNPQRFKPVRATGNDQMDFSPSPLIVQNGVVEYAINRKHFVNASVKIQGAVDLQTGGNSVVTQQLGLGLDRFVPSLWEIIPYSFLVDYFSNVGDIISSWAFGTKNLRWAFKGTRVETVFEHFVSEYSKNTLVGDGTFSLKRALPCTSRGSHVVHNREPSIDSLVPSFRLEIPGMASTKWLNLAALAASRKALTPY